MTRVPSTGGVALQTALVVGLLFSPAASSFSSELPCFDYDRELSAEKPGVRVTPGFVARVERAHYFGDHHQVVRSQGQGWH
jgi:hypothetical protein